MAESENNSVRDDLPRVSLESIQDWHRIKENVNSAALVTLESKLAERGLTNQRHILLPHLKQVSRFLLNILYLTVEYLLVCRQNLSDCETEPTYQWT